MVDLGGAGLLRFLYRLNGNFRAACRQARRPKGHAILSATVEIETLSRPTAAAPQSGRAGCRQFEPKADLKSAVPRSIFTGGRNDLKAMQKFATSRFGDVRLDVRLAPLA